MSVYRLAIATLLAALLSGCANGNSLAPVASNKELPVSEPPPPHSSGPNPEIVAALECLNRSGLLRNTRFAIAVHADGTGKTVSGYDGATGSILPQGTSAIWAAQAVMYAGAIAQNYYELNTERALRQFGGASVDKSLTVKNDSQQPNFVISTAFTALDFLGGPDMDLRIGGIGPQLQSRGASLEVSAEIYRPGDRTTLAISSMSRQVRYNFQGINVSKLAQSLDNTLITGGISWSDQQRMQEASRDLIALAVADVLSSVPGTPENCRQQVETLVNKPAPAKKLSDASERPGIPGGAGEQREDPRAIRPKYA